MQEAAIKPSDIAFMVVGAEKSGTTWLANTLREHPQIYIPAQKELHYFNRHLDEAPELENYNFGKPVDWYLDFFRLAAPGQFKGECCPAYLWDEFAAGEIHRFNPGVKIIMILRNPVERFFSAARYARQRGNVTSTDRESILGKHKAFLLDRGAYYEQVKRYTDVFPRDQIRIYWFDDLRKDNRMLLLDVEEFIGAVPLIPPNIDQEQNVTAEPRFPALSRSMAALRRFTRKYHLNWLIELARASGLAGIFTSLRDQNKLEGKTSRLADLGDLDRSWLFDYYKEDIGKLEELLGVDLGNWKNPG